jgi:hypothetical protein
MSQKIIKSHVMRQMNNLKQVYAYEIIPNQIWQLLHAVSMS